MFVAARAVRPRCFGRISRPLPRAGAGSVGAPVPAGLCQPGRCWPRRLPSAGTEGGGAGDEAVNANEKRTPSLQPYRLLACALILV